MAASAKLLIHISVIAGLVVQATLGSREFGPLLFLTLGALAAGFTLVKLFPVWGWTPILITAYVYPVMFRATREFFTFSYYAIFLAGVMGGILASAHVTRWHLPKAWRLPLAYWGLVLALTWPVVALREMNFVWHSIAKWASTNANSGLGGPPDSIVITMLLSLLPAAVGILWFDAMFAAFGQSGVARFRRAILAPLAVSLLASSALAIYQWAFDLEFLSAHQWPHYVKRAAGGLLDGNASGQLFGLWSSAALTWGIAGSGLAAIAGAVISLIAWVAVWSTGSRMALLAALIGLAFAAYAAIRGAAKAGFRIWRVGAALAGMVLVAGILVYSARSASDPVSRMLAELPQPNRDAIGKFVDFQFWNRFGPFGTSWAAMIQDHPVLGIGPGVFEPIYVDYAYVVTKGATRSHFDNAQSWYRHQLVELGIVGSLGWIAWVMVFAPYVWRSAPAREGLREATGVRAALIALAVISIVSMPGRNVFVALTFWVFAFWLTALTGEPERPQWMTALEGRRRAWAAVVTLAVLFAAATGWYGYRYLRPPHRAMMANWDYLNGVSRPSTTAEGVVRYTEPQASAVFYAPPGQYLQLSYKLPHADAASSPVKVRVFHRDEQVGNFTIADSNWHDFYIQVPEGAPDRMMLQVKVDRPAVNAGAPARGLIVKDWTFVPNPPPGSSVAGRVSAAR